jgi:hypothetical protein
MPTVTLTMPASGALSFADLQRVFGQTNLGALYRGGANVANISANNGVPTSGAISLGNFYSAQGSVFVNDLSDSYLQSFSTAPGEELISIWFPTIASRPWRVRWNYTGGASIYNPFGTNLALNTWTDRTANQSGGIQLRTANSPAVGGPVWHTGTVTIEYAPPGSTTPFFTHNLNYSHEIGAGGGGN